MRGRRVRVRFLVFADDGDTAGNGFFGTLRFTYRSSSISWIPRDRAERKKILALAQAREIDVVLVTELTRWGRSMLDLFHTLQDLQSWDVSLVAQTGLQFDLRSAQGKLIASLMAALAEFERDLLRERVRSGIAAAQKRGVVFGRRAGHRVKADRFAPKVLKLVSEGQSYREISHRLGLSKNTVLDIVKRDRAA